MARRRSGRTQPEAERVRQRVTLRMHPDIARALDQQVQDLGMTKADYVEAVLLESFGREVATTN